MSIDTMPGETRPSGTLLKLVMTVVLALPFLSGCTQTATETAMEGADYGLPLSSRDCIAAVEEKLKYAMKSPSSVRWRHDGACYRGSWASGADKGVPPLYGYVQEGAFDDIDSPEGYSGFRRYRALVRDGWVVRYCVTDPSGACVPGS